MNTAPPIDVLLVGAGLANSLIAIRLRSLRPNLRIVMIEARPAADDAHTWCLFETDLADADRAWVRPMLDHHWDGYDVAFPDLRRTLSTGYGCLTSRTLAREVERLLGADMRYGCTVAAMDATSVTLADQEQMEASLVIDGRGAHRSDAVSLAWQKFVGLELRLSAQHGLVRPIVMDATVPQRDGYRFIYVLPLSTDTLLIEDTRYSAGADLDQDDLSDEVLSYAAAQGWVVDSVLRRESGVLPITLGGDPDRYWSEIAEPTARSGLRALLFHPVTGYSLPEAIGLASAIAAAPALSTPAIETMVRGRSDALWRRNGYLRLLNRMMFKAAEPGERYRVLQRFYHLPQPLVERFYAGRLTWGDRLRILSGKPPVPVHKALGAVRLKEDRPHG
ncbi:lycopene beta-cyclase CrtY [Brevundimonas sp. PAMC22021]|uniref:lycopene beta-cyclase CrtY n=1 Tax=Brevundimonas sp. PAMC22021 TaxID=2861285 RepID=UPI002103DEE1|nr:lycopene beta-cyclase CrtY [Brevundimonas sp. PAMC22021]